MVQSAGEGVVSSLDVLRAWMVQDPILSVQCPRRDSSCPLKDLLAVSQKSGKQKLWDVSSMLGSDLAYDVLRFCG